MNFIKINTPKFLILIIFMMPWASANALEKFRDTGVVEKMGSNSLIVRDERYVLTRSARVSSTAGGSKNSLNQLKKGDHVLVEGKILDGVHYADIVVYLPTKNR